MALSRGYVVVSLIAGALALSGCAGANAGKVAGESVQSAEESESAVPVESVTPTPTPSRGASQGVKSSPTPELRLRPIDYDFLASAREFDVDFDGRLDDDDGEAELIDMGRELCDVLEDIPQSDRSIEYVMSVAADFGAEYDLDEEESAFLFGAAGGTYCDGYGWTLLVE